MTTSPIPNVKEALKAIGVIPKTPIPDVPEDLKKYVEEEFGEDFNITWKTATTVTIEPKDEPSILAATLLPLYKTRYSYDLMFDDQNEDGGDDASGKAKIRMKDNYAVTFNRTNGSSEAQQDKLHDMEEQMIGHCQNIMKKMKKPVALKVNSVYLKV